MTKGQNVNARKALSRVRYEDQIQHKEVGALGGEDRCYTEHERQGIKAAALIAKGHVTIRQ